jgi:hypothetical protein
MIEIEVRWNDGYLEKFSDIVKWRCGNYTLYIKHENGIQEWIPLISVRRFKFTSECSN